MMRVILSILAVSFGIHTQSMAASQSGDWKFGDVGAGYCGTWTSKGRMRTTGGGGDRDSMGTGNSSFNGDLLFFVRFPKDNNQLPIVTMELSHKIFQRVAGAREREIPKESTDGAWIFVGNSNKKVGSKTKKFAVYTLFPGKMVDTINRIRTKKYLDFRMRPRFKAQLYTTISLKGSTAAMNATSGTCAGRPGLGVTQKNNEDLRRLVDTSTQSQGYKNWKGSIVAQYPVLNEILGEESALTAEVNGVQNDSKHVSLRNELSKTNNSLEANSDELAGTNEMLSAYILEKNKKESIQLPNAIDEQADLIKTVPGMKSAYEKAKAKYDPVVATLRPYRAEVAEKKNQLNIATSTKNGFINQRNSAQSHLSNTVASIDSALRDIENKRRQISGNSNEIEDVEEEIEDLDRDEVIADIEEEAADEMGEFGSIGFDEMEERVEDLQDQLVRVTQRHSKFSTLADVAENVEAQVNAIQKFKDLIAALPTEDDFVALEAEMVEKECAANMKNANCAQLNKTKACMMTQLGKAKVKKRRLFRKGTREHCLPLGHLEARMNNHIEEIVKIQDNVSEIQIRVPKNAAQNTEIRPLKKKFQNCDAHGTKRNCLGPAKKLSNVAEVLESRTQQRKLDLEIDVERVERVHNRMHTKLASRYTDVMESLESRLENLEDSNLSLRRQIRQANISIESNRVRKNELISRISHLESEIVTWTSNEATQQRQLAKAESSLAKKEDQLDYHNIKAKHDSTKAAYFPSKARLEAVTAEIKEMRARIAFLKGEIPSLEATVSELEATFASLKFKKSGLEAEIKPYKDEIRALMAKLGPIQNRQNKLMDEITGFLVSVD